MNWSKTVLTTVLAAGTVLGVSAQDNNTPTFGLQKSFGIDSINLVTLTPELNIPVYSKPGPLTFAPHFLLQTPCNLYNYYNGSRNEIQVLCLSNSPFVVDASDRYVGIIYSHTMIGSCSYYYNFRLGEPDGSSHPFYSAGVYTTSNCGATSGTFIASDDTGYQIYLSASASGLSTSIYDAAGNTYFGNPSAATIKDPYGNMISKATNTWTDEYGIASPIYTSNQLTWLDSSGNNQTLQVGGNTSSIISTNFGACVQVQESGSGRTFITSLDYPDGSTIGLSYEQGSAPGTFTGRLGGFTTRQGGAVTYTYSGAVCNATGSGPTISGGVYPTTLTRTDADGTWTLSVSWGLVDNGLVDQETTTVLDPGQNKTVYTFTGFNVAVAPSGTSPNLTEVQAYQNTGTVSSPTYTLLKTIVYCYNGNATSCPTTFSRFPITERDVYTTIGSMSTSSRVQQLLDSYGNITSAAQYDFGVTSATLTTTTTYGSWNGSSCVSIGSYINNRPCDIKVANGSNTISETRNTYDPHGGLTETQKWTGSTWLATTFTRNPKGTIATMTSPAGLVTTYGYTGVDGCNSLQETSSSASIATGDTLTTSTEWNCYLAKPIQITDYNGNNTTYTYNDPLGRITSMTDPLENLTSYSYPTPTTSETVMNFNGSVSTSDTLITTDGLGRQIFTQTRQGQGSSMFDTIQTSYGWAATGPFTASSEPCSTTSGSGCTTVHTNYLDPLGRLYQHITTYNEELTHTYTQNDDLSVLSFPPSGENNKQVQTQYDGLGRPTSVCGISSIVSGNVLCRQNTNTSATGVLTAIFYASATGSQTVSSTRGSQTRSQTYDALGRITLITTPEGGMTTNVYDSAPSSCNGQASAHAGELIYTGYANGNYSCYQYDSLGRIAAVTGNSGSGGGPVCRRFYYDNSSGVLGALPSGISPQYPYGRRVDAETDTCAWPVTSSSMITDEWFSYDKDGHVKDMWELTPYSGTYYHSQATFAGNGVPLTVQLANPSLYTETYGLDGEGRLATLSSSGTTIVAGTTYNASSQPTYIDLGTGTDQSDYGWDPNTGRMKNWTFKVGNASETGTLTWNGNGTLRQLAIVDGFNPGGSQTCTFGTSTVMGYDDLGRLLNDNCGSVWQQTFSYNDQYDNLTKSGSSAWNPGYSPANNHYSIGSYDANGNVTNDLSHTYSWDQFGKLRSIDSSSCASNGECITYDALGRIVETSYNGVYTEIWYTQLGKTVYMHGSTPQYAYWPTPGNGTVEVNGNNATFYYMHKDWLGNSRISSVIGSSQVVSDQAYAPYGEVYNKQATGASTPAQMFTGDTQDVIGGIFDTPNRELNSGQGRWLSPDPAQQSWNAYAYVTDPNTETDPTGLGQGLSGPGQPAPGCSASITQDCDTVTPSEDSAQNTQAAAASAAAGCLAGGCEAASAGAATTATGTATTTTATAVVTDVLSVVALPLIVLDYLISPNSGPVAIDSTDQLPNNGTPASTSQQGAVDTNPMAAEHTTARPSTEEKHEQGQARRDKDRGGEKGDARRRPPRTRPDGWKGPWPPKQGTKWW